MDRNWVPELLQQKGIASDSIKFDFENFGLK